MKIAGFVKNSLVDYPGAIAAVVFTQGCNLNCGYCHNRCLIEEKDRLPGPSVQDVLTFLERRRGLLDAVVVSGGEPTIQPRLISFIHDVRQMGFKVKLDTNGTNPLVLDTIVKDGLVDYVAMDVKAPLHKYEMICGCPVNTDAVQKSIRILMNGSVDYEFRTTFAPQSDSYDLVEMAELVKGAKKYVLQQYREVNPQMGELTGVVEKRKILSDMWEAVHSLVPMIQTRGEFAVV